MGFQEFFTGATGLSAPFEFQARLAAEAWPDVVNIPTGMGKTAAVTLAWLWKRGWRSGGRGASPESGTPRRLVWCLPMRVLVEQTEENVRGWLEKLGIRGEAGEGRASVHVLMGGSEDSGWASYPEEDAIVVGTQDMLLSRALMRGYGMSRYRWPIDFALLHNDCLWVFDEVQLMGAGLPTSAQLEAFRRSLAVAKSSRSLWMSATWNQQWLETVDFKPYCSALRRLGLRDADREQGRERLEAVKQVQKLPVRLEANVKSKDGLASYCERLGQAVLEHHSEDAQTIVVVNRVERAQGVFRWLEKQRNGKTDLLVHSRFRTVERSVQNQALRAAQPDRIIVATQAIEAGVDISCRVLVTELAPWASLVQRFGRCNRNGEYDSAKVLWVDADDDADALLPYEADQVAVAREHMASLTSASPRDLPAVEEARPVTAIVRRKDLLDLFNTDPDLSGFDVDVSDYIRDNGRPGIEVFWRAFVDPNQPEPQGRPRRVELCPVSMSQAAGIEKRGAWYWDTLGAGEGKYKSEGRWVRLTAPARPRPGMTLLLEASSGGYDPKIGFDAGLKAVVQPVGVGGPELGSYASDHSSQASVPVALTDHLAHVARQAAALGGTLGQATHADALARAARWHDVGKAHPVFDRTMHTCAEAPAGFLAKSPCRGRHQRRFFRHELASALAWLAQHEGEPDADLIAYLIAAHHGKVRTSLRAMPTEEADASATRYARGVWEGDVLPALRFDGECSEKTTLRLALMEIGLGEQGPSWTERTLKLLDEYGPFQLAWLETLIRLADWRASAAEQQQERQAHA